MSSEDVTSESEPHQGDEPTFDDAPRASERIDAFEFVGAVHRLVNARQQSTVRELILSAALESLRGGSRDTGEVAEQIFHIWPGARPSNDLVARALQDGAALGLVVKMDGLNGPLWQLTAAGSEDVAAQQEWVARAQDKGVADLVSMARSGLELELGHAQARVLLDRLVKALIVGIQVSQAAYLGNIEKLLDGTVKPKAVDRERVLRELSDPRMDESTREFLLAAAVSALDPADPFGNELVSHITTGCVLHAYAVGRDNAELRGKLGRVAGERAILDTPILLTLIGPQGPADQVRQTIKYAIAGGWEVVVCEHYLEELIDVLESAGDRLRHRLASALENGQKAAWYASLVEEQIDSIVVTSLNEGRYRSYDELVASARRLGSDLRRLGAEVRRANNDNDRHYVNKCREALEHQLEGRRQRTEVGVQRDAETMAMAWRARRRRTEGAWPGAWVITRDRSMGPAFLSACPSDNVSLTISLAQWTTFVALLAEPPSVQELAEAAAGQLVDEAFWSIPSRYPTDVALELAGQLSPEHGGSAVDFRVAQLSLDDFLDAETGEPRTALSVSAEVMSRRAKRLNEAHRRQAERAETTVREAETQAGKDRERALRLELERDEQARDIAAVRAESNLAREELRIERQRNSRIRLSAFPIVTGLIILTAAVVLTAWIVALVALAGIVVLAWSAARWVNTPDSSWTTLVAGLVLEGVAFAASVWDLVDRFTS